MGVGAIEQMVVTKTTESSPFCYTWHLLPRPFQEKNILSLTIRKSYRTPTGNINIGMPDRILR